MAIQLYHPHPNLPPNGHGKSHPLIMKLAMPVSPYPTFPRKREKGQTNRCASFTLKGEGVKLKPPRAAHGFIGAFEALT